MLSQTKVWLRQSTSNLKLQKLPCGGGPAAPKSPCGQSTAQVDPPLQFVKTQAHTGDPTAKAVLEALLLPAEGEGGGDVEMGGGLGNAASGGPALGVTTSVVPPALQAPRLVWLGEAGPPVVRRRVAQGVSGALGGGWRTFTRPEHPPCPAQPVANPAGQQSLGTYFGVRAEGFPERDSPLTHGKLHDVSCHALSLLMFCGLTGWLATNASMSCKLSSCSLGIPLKNKFNKITDFYKHPCLGVLFPSLL